MSKATGMTAHTLRYYERAELIRRVARDSRNQRQYSVADVEWGNFLSRLRETGMPIAQMREYAALRERGLATTAQRLRLLEAHRANLHEQITRLRSHEDALTKKIAIYARELAVAHTVRPEGTANE